MVRSKVKVITVGSSQTIQLQCIGYPLPKVTCLLVPHMINEQLQRIPIRLETKTITNITVASITWFRHKINFDVTPNEAGVLHCMAENSVGRAELGMCVEKNLFIHNTHAGQSIYVGQEVTLLCISSDEYAFIDWYLNGNLKDSVDGK